MYIVLMLCVDVSIDNVILKL